MIPDGCLESLKSLPDLERTKASERYYQQVAKGDQKAEEVCTIFDFSLDHQLEDTNLVEVCGSIRGVYQVFRGVYQGCIYQGSISGVYLATCQ